MSFASAFAKVSYYEGVHNVDAGGDTWYGISRNAHPEINPWPPTDSQVTTFYRQQWSDSGAMHVPEPADIAYFLAYINLGPKAAVRCLQRACRANGRYCDDDGQFGPETLKAVAFADGMMLMTSLRSEVAAEYRLIAQHKPNSPLEGWLKRAYGEQL